MLFRPKDQTEKFQCYLNCQHRNTTFTFEMEQTNSILLLDTKIRRVNHSFSASIYRKLTFSGVFTNFGNIIPISYKSNMIFTLLFRAFKFWTNFGLFHQEALNLFQKKWLSCNFIDVCIKRLLNNIFKDKKVCAFACKKELVCVLPFIGKKSLQLISKSVQNILNFCHLNLPFHSPYKLRTFFRFKDTSDKKIRSDIVYRYSCSSCSATYYGKT